MNKFIQLQFGGNFSSAGITKAQLVKLLLLSESYGVVEFLLDLLARSVVDISEVMDAAAMTGNNDKVNSLLVGMKNKPNITCTCLACSLMIACCVKNLQIAENIMSYINLPNHIEDVDSVEGFTKEVIENTSYAYRVIAGNNSGLMVVSSEYYLPGTI